MLLTKYIEKGNGHVAQLMNIIPKKIFKRSLQAQKESWQQKRKRALRFASCTGSVTVETALVEGTPRLIDVIDGTVYEIPETNIEDNGRGVRIFRNIPLKDSPLLLTFGDFADIVPC